MSAARNQIVTRFLEEDTDKQHLVMINARMVPLPSEPVHAQPGSTTVAVEGVPVPREASGSGTARTLTEPGKLVYAACFGRYGLAGHYPHFDTACFRASRPSRRPSTSNTSGRRAPSTPPSSATATATATVKPPTEASARRAPASTSAFYVTDANFNVTALVQGTPGDSGLGHVVERYLYDPYGKVTVLHGEKDTSDPENPIYYDKDGDVTEWDEDTGGSDWDNEILFCGYRFDPETSLSHVRHRMYHPTLGRWLQRDPLVLGT